MGTATLSLIISSTAFAKFVLNIELISIRLSYAVILKCVRQQNQSGKKSANSSENVGDVEERKEPGEDDSICVGSVIICCLSNDWHGDRTNHC